MLALSLAVTLSASVVDSTEIEEALRLYEAVEMEAAAARFERALPRCVDDRERAWVHAWLGLVHGQLGRVDRARSEFLTAAELDLDVAMPAPAPPAIEALLEQARAQAKSGVGVRPRRPDAPQVKPPPLSVTGQALAGTGAALLAASAVVFAFGVDTALRQAPQAEFMDDAFALHDLAYAEYAVSGALAAGGVACVLTATALLLE